MEEGRQIQAGNPAEASDKVVRLPRDWLGPREHLVPIARSAPPPTEPELDGFAPTADDFWGERAAAIHDVVQAWEPEPRQDATDREPRGTRRTPRLGRRRLAAVALAGIAGIAAAGAIALLLSGSPRPNLGGARLNIAAILNTGVSRIEAITPPRIVAVGSVFRAVKSKPHRPSHPNRPSHPKATAVPHHHTTPSPASTYVAHAQPIYHPTTSQPASHVYTPPPPASHTRRPAASTASSGANVSPTGQTGALGPVQSPNG